MNFLPYLKLNLKMIRQDLILILVCGVLFLLAIRMFIGVIFLPWIMMGIALLTILPVKKLREESLFGPSSALHMSLPVDARTMVTVKLLAGALVGLTTAAALILPVAVSGFGGIFQLNKVYEAADAGGQGKLAVTMMVVDLFLLLLLVDAADLARVLWFRSRPLGMQTRGREITFNLVTSIPFLAFIFWNAVRDRTKTPFLDWLASGSVLPVLLTAAAAEIILYILAARASIKLLETRYQKI